MVIGKSALPFPIHVSPNRSPFRGQSRVQVSCLSLKKRHYIMLVSRDEDGKLNKVPVPLHYAYIFVAAAAIGMFTIAGLAGSYSRMLIKTARFNQLRQDHNALQQDYAHLEKAKHEKDIEAASLGSLAGEVSALYGLTANKLAVPMGRLTDRASRGKSSGTESAKLATTPVEDESYFKSLNSFYTLRTSAMSGITARALASSPVFGFGHSLNHISGFDDSDTVAFAPNLWPVMGPITSGFGEREDPVLGNGEGEFHAGVDISAPIGTPVRATADGVVITAGFGNGYGREVVLDHGHGLKTLYGHMSGFNVIAGQTVIRGEIIGYVGHSGRTTGNHLHYEVKINNTPVNPHKYLSTTLADLGTGAKAF
jgi:murein DD-endopeptidase MepM/ murein hydrolase activator NlpD